MLLPVRCGSVWNDVCTEFKSVYLEDDHDIYCTVQ